MPQVRNATISTLAFWNDAQMSRMPKCMEVKLMWIWPLLKFWEYSPQGFVLAVIWNCCEFAHIRMPFAPKAFEIITQKKGERKSHDNQ